MKCANCDKNALYMYRMTRNKALYYCGKDLPKFLDERRRAGLLAITEEFTKEKVRFYTGLNNPTYEQGWLNRVGQVRTHALTMVG